MSKSWMPITSEIRRLVLLLYVSPTRSGAAPQYFSDVRGRSTHFADNTSPVATVIALAEHKSSRRIWTECYFWSFPYYFVGAVVAVLVSIVNRYFGWQSSLLFLPPMFLIYRSYRL